MEATIVMEQCRTPQLGDGAGQPFAWVAVGGLPEGFRPSVAEVTRPEGGTDTLLAPVVVAENGEALLQVPIHPSFERTGGPVTIRIYAEDHSCDPVPFIVSELDAAPGTLVETTNLLRAAMDLMVAGPESVTGPGLTEDLAEAPENLSVLTIPALWAIPDLEELEALVDSTVAAGEDEMSDAIAARLELPERMREFAALVLAAQQVSGDMTVGAAVRRAAGQPGGAADQLGHSGTSNAAPGSAPAPAASHSLPGSALGYQPASGGLPVGFASTRIATRRSALSPPVARGGGGDRPSRSAFSSSASQTAGACSEDQFNLFDIGDPAFLDTLMRIQHYSERFQRGATDQPDRSASGMFFGDVGVLVAHLPLRGPAERAAKMWKSFSKVVLTSTQGFSELLPSDMELSVVASPAVFAEDSEANGRWTAGAMATSRGMRLTREIVASVMTEALSRGLDDASLGDPLREMFTPPTPDGEFWEQVIDEATERLGKDLDSAAKKEATDALKSLLDALGAEEGPDWFDIPPGCWTLPDMLAGGGAGGAAAGDLQAPPLLERPDLEGPGVRWSSPEVDIPRVYQPAAAAASTIRVRTVEDYRLRLEIPTDNPILNLGGVDQFNIGTTYAFGGEQSVGSTRVEVRAIDIHVEPSVVRIEPGQPVPFTARIRNAMDTHVEWRATAGTFVDLVSHQEGEFCPPGSMGPEGRHEATLVTEGVPLSEYPILVEVVSMSNCGIRTGDAPDRKGTAAVQIEAPVMLISPPQVCLAPGETMQFRAEFLGGGGRVRWSKTGGRIDRDGLYEAPGSSGTYEVTATSTDDSSVSATSVVRVGTDCCAFSAMVSAGPRSGLHGGTATVFGPTVILSDAEGGWELTVVIPAFEEGEYDTRVAVVADFPHPYEAGQTVAVPADAPDGEPSAPATLRIDHAEGDFRIGRGEGSIQGRVQGRAGWRDRNGGDVYFNVDAWFRAVKFAVGPNSPYEACRGGWGLDSSAELMRQLEGQNP